MPDAWMREAGGDNINTNNRPHDVMNAITPEVRLDIKDKAQMCYL